MFSVGYLALVMSPQYFTDNLYKSIIYRGWPNNMGQLLFTFQSTE